MGIAGILLENYSLPLSLKPSNTYESYFRVIYQQIGLFWSNRTIHNHYTNHGLDHSQRISFNIDKLLKSDPDFLQDIEKFILLVSIFLHDIGMQSPQHSGLEKKTTYSFEELELVRNNHNKASSKMIKDSIKADAVIDFGLKPCKQYIEDIAKLALYHREENLGDLEDAHHGGINIRLKLLATLLRFGDELDADFQRVEMDYLKLVDIPTISKYHWWSHHFVESVNIEKDKISLSFRFPKEFKNKLKILKVFKTKILDSMNETFEQVYTILFDYEIKLHSPITIKSPRYTSEGVLENIPNDLMNFIMDEISRIENTSDSVIMVKKLDEIIPEKISKFIRNLLKKKRLEKPEFNIHTEIENSFTNFQFRVYLGEKAIYFKELSVIPSRYQLESIPNL